MLDSYISSLFAYGYRTTRAGWSCSARSFEPESSHAHFPLASHSKHPISFAGRPYEPGWARPRRFAVAGRIAGGREHERIAIDECFKFEALERGDKVGELGRIGC